MKAPGNAPATSTEAPPRRSGRGGLFRKYVGLFIAVVGLALIPNGVLDSWLSYEEQKELLVRVQKGQAEAAADKIGRFVKEIEGQISWMTQLPWQAKTRDEWRFDAARLLRQAPAVTELVQLDEEGREQYRMSRQAMDAIGRLTDFSRDTAFVKGIANKVYYGPVYFVRESEPYMTVALGGPRPDYGVIVGQVNLKFIWDVVTQIKVGKEGKAFVVDALGRLIAHPDISLVLRNMDLSQLAHISGARAPAPVQGDWPSVAVDLNGRRVLSAHAAVASLGWLVFAEMPIDEAYAPLYATLIRSGLLLLFALALAFFAGLFLARRMVGPIRTLHDGAARIAGGDLGQRIFIKTGDELEALGDQFNRMAVRLQESYATLERKVEERTRELEVANLAKSRFLAAASHDLRQPLHALGLFIAQLHGRTRADDRRKIIGRIDAAISAMNELFNALLDVSKLDAGVLTPQRTDVSLAQLLRRVEATFSDAAREKGLTLRIVASSVWLHSDFILLERIVFNLVSNAIRYTAAGRVVVGCRRRGGRLQIEVWDTGPGIPADQRRNIFSEFYRLGGSAGEQQAGLGLGLAIVERLSRLLDHPIELKSTVGKGSCFSVLVPHVSVCPEPGVALKPAAEASLNAPNGKVVVVIDDDRLVLEGMSGLFRSWGCRVVTGTSQSAALAGLMEYDRLPDVIISDYRLGDGRTGIEVIADMRRTLASPVPAFLVSGDTDPVALQEARANGLMLLHKPVDPMALRATFTQLVRKRFFK